MKTILYIKLISVITLSVLFTDIYAQNHLRRAEQHLDKLEYALAAAQYEKHFETNLPKKQDLRNIAFSYLHINDYKNAVKWFEKLMEYNNVDPDCVLMYARLLKTEGRYDESIDILNRYKIFIPENKEEVDIWTAVINDAITWKENPTHFLVENAPEFNTEYSDFGLIEFPDGFILTSDRKHNNKIYGEEDLFGGTGTPYLKLYHIIKNEGEGIKSKLPIDDLNDIYHNGPGFFCNKTNTLYFTRTKMVKARKRNLNNDPTSWVENVNVEEHVNRLEIYSAELVNGNWRNIKAFDHNNPNLYSVGHPTISPNGKIMYFASDMDGSVGRTDIFYSEKQADGSWSTPTNAGDVINTTGKEMFPYVDKDGTLYFSSDGHPGMGGLDIFYSSGSKNQWTVPENMKSPINSPKDDFSLIFTVSEEQGYFSSNRDGGKGKDDIYSFKYSPPPIPTELILAVKTLERLDDGEIISLSGINVHYHKDGDESEEFEVPEKSPGIYYTNIDCDSKYLIHGINPDFFSQSKEIQTICETMNDTIFVELIFDRIVIDKPIAIENIYYDYDKYNIRPDAAIELDKIVTLLIENPQIIIELGSHTDSRGSHAYNDRLSQRRAESAVEYIISRGISSERITAKGYGERVLVNHCSNGVRCSEEEHQKNRRTEFKVTGYSKSQPTIYSEM